MVQHELLMVVAAPLIVAGRPLVAFLRTLPREQRLVVGQYARRASIRSPWAWISQPFVAWLIHAIAIWGWHAPRMFDGALENDVVHAFEHAVFLGTALLFWSSIIHPARRSERGVVVISLFTTALHTSLLGALMTFARAPWYSYTAADGLSALDDQHLAGMIMWIPAGLAYLIAALLVMRRWLAESDLGPSYQQSELALGATRPS